MTTLPPSFSLHAANADDTAAFIALRGKTRQNAISKERLAEVGITADIWAAMMRSGSLPGYVCHRDGQPARLCLPSRRPAGRLLLWRAHDG